MPKQDRTITTATGLDDWPATPDARYGQLDADNTWSGMQSMFQFAGNHVPSISNMGQRFDANDSSTPSGWTEADAANSSNQNDIAGFWYLQNNSNQSWDYHKALSLPATSWQSTEFMGVRIRDGGFTGDQNLYYGIYGDSGSGISDDIYLRCNVHWDSVAGIWEVRGQYKDGTTHVDGSWEPLDNFMPRDFYIRCVKRSDANTIRVYFGASQYPNQQKAILNTSMDRTVWDDGVHARLESTHSGGIQMYAHIGALDIGNSP